MKYETKLMPKKPHLQMKKKKSYFQARVYKFSKSNQLSVVPVSSEAAFAHSLE